MAYESYLAVPVTTFVTFLYFLGKDFYQSLKKKEGKIKQKINNDIDSSMAHYKKRKKEIGIEKFANKLLKFSMLERKLKEGKYSFERHMTLSIVFVLIFGVLYSVLPPVFVSGPPPFLLGMVYGALFFSLYVFVYHFFRLWFYKIRIERYLGGESIDKIFKDVKIV